VDHNYKTLLKNEVFIYDMKKILLKESQVKYIIDKLMDTTISEQLGYGGRALDRETRRAQRKKIEGPSDWGGGTSGTFNFLQAPFGAVNVFQNQDRDGREYTFKIAHTANATIGGEAMPGKQTPPKETPPQKQEPTLSTFTVQGSSLPYADNMVKPYFDKYPDALGTFNEILRRFVEYIKNGGGPNLTNVTIKGSADSAAPTTDIPAGYSKLDHPSGKPYNGLTDPRERNQYLADTRASEYARVLSTRIKELTGFDLNIKVLPGDNYYGQPGKRGVEFRSIVLTPNAGELKKVDQPTPETPATVTPATSQPGGKVKIPNISYRVPFSKDGKNYTINGYRVYDETTNGVFLAVSQESATSRQIPKFDGIMESKIENGNFYVGNNLIGEIESINNAPSNLQTIHKGALYFVGPITAIREYRNEEIEGKGTVSLTYIDDYYFFFHKNNSVE
jgi:hypothetical protein